MRFGAFCPFPFPLGGDWTAAQHARLASDVVALRRTRRFARVTVTKSGSTITVTANHGVPGNGSGHQPLTLSFGTGDFLLSWAAYTDPLNEDRKIAPNIVAGKATVHGATAGIATVEITNAGSIRVRTFNAAGTAADYKVTVTVIERLNASIGTYDGATDKIDSSTENSVPHAWVWYTEITGWLGSAFTTSRNSIVHCRKLALARSEAARTRAAERLAANALPDTADETLEKWVDLLNVAAHPDTSRQQLRQLCAAKFRLARGPTIANEDEAIAKLLGNAFVRTWRQEGSDLANPPIQTFWPGINAGPVAYDLGGGAWLSERRHLVVEVQQPPGVPLGEFMRLVNVDLFRMLDDMLPSTATFNWATNVSTGFLLDISDLDWDGMTP